MNLSRLFFIVVLSVVFGTLLRGQSRPRISSQRTDQSLACSVEPRHTPLPDLWTTQGGEIRATLVVGRGGEVADVNVARTTYTPDKTEAAVKVVRSWRFEPATKNGQVVAVRVHAVITFTKTAANIAFRFDWPKGQRGCVPFPMPIY